MSKTIRGFITHLGSKLRNIEDSIVAAKRKRDWDKSRYLSNKHDELKRMQTYARHWNGEYDETKSN